jgi:threonine synthase
MLRFAERLAMPEFLTLGEGDTPFVRSPRLARALGIENLYLKLEGANPTGSHKDRMSAQFVAWASYRKAPVVAAASSGNAGASLAAYAAAAGIPCVVVSSASIAPPWRRAIEMSGAQLEFIEDIPARWAYIRRRVVAEGWASATNLALPAVGSDPIGVDGYRTLGYELGEHISQVEVDAILVPTSRGDLLWGIYLGLREHVSEGSLAQVPPLVAVEPFPRIERVLMSGADWRAHFAGRSALASIGGSTVTQQSLVAIEATQGTAVAVDAEDVGRDARLAAANGLYLELSSVAAITAIRSLQRRQWRRVNSVIVVATSHGYKDI